MKGSNLSKSPIDPNLRKPTPKVEQPNEWTFEETKLFENALTEVDGLNSCQLFEKNTAKVQAKTVAEIENHYEALVEDVEKIETGKIPLPEYNPIKPEVVRRNRRTRKKKKGTTSPMGKIIRRWTEEHKLLTIEYEKHGSVWRNMSDEHVKNKTPTQVATHSRRYFDRINKRSQADTNSIKPTAHSSSSSSSSGANPPSNNNNNVTQKSSLGIRENQPTNHHFSGQMPLSCNSIHINNIETDEGEEDLLDLDKFPSIYD